MDLLVYVSVSDALLLGGEFVMHVPKDGSIRVDLRVVKLLPCSVVDAVPYLAVVKKVCGDKRVDVDNVVRVVG